MNHRFLSCLVTVVVCCQSLSAADFHDDFSNPKLEIRHALRGEWTYTDGVASCKADPELYKKFKNHGPILRWPAEFTNGTIEFAMQAKDCQRLVITLNEKGHVFRIGLNDKDRTKIFGWIGQSSKENKPKTIAQDGVPTVASLNDQWITCKLVFQGSKADIVIGDYKASLSHESIGRKKGEFTISFASGSLSVKDVRLTCAD